MVKRWQSAVVALAATLGIVLTATRAQAHPIHSSVAEIRRIAPSGVVRATIRVFMDDLGEALTKRRAALSADADVVAYVASRLSLEVSGRPLPLSGCGVRRDGGLIWVCLESGTAAPLEELSLRNSILVEVFPEQVNVVRAELRGGTRSTLFTRGDGAKRLY